jgi:hypothetical protein
MEGTVRRNNPFDLLAARVSSPKKRASDTLYDSLLDGANWRLDLGPPHSQQQQHQQHQQPQQQHQYYQQQQQQQYHQQPQQPQQSFCEFDAFQPGTGGEHDWVSDLFLEKTPVPVQNFEKELDFGEVTWSLSELAVADAEDLVEGMSEKKERRKSTHKKEKERRKSHKVEEAGEAGIEEPKTQKKSTKHRSKVGDIDEGGEEQEKKPKEKKKKKEKERAVIEAVGAEEIARSPWRMERVQMTTRMGFK